MSMWCGPDFFVGVFISKSVAKKFNFATSPQCLTLA